MIGQQILSQDRSMTIEEGDLARFLTNSNATPLIDYVKGSRCAISKGASAEKIKSQLLSQSRITPNANGPPQNI